MIVLKLNRHMKNRFLNLLLVGLLQLLCAEAFSSTVYFYRPKSLLMSGTKLTIAINDTLKFDLTNGSFHQFETNAKSISIITSANNSGVKNIALEAGKNYYVRVEMKGINSVELIQETEFAGKPAIERLKADSKAEEEAKNLKTVNVTNVLPLPDSTADKATIYLFRPFNVVGVSFIAKVSDGENVYEMKNKSSHVITTDKSEIHFRTVNDGASISNTTLDLKLQKGKVYYVAVLRNGGAIVLSEAKKEYARQEMKLQ